MPGVSLLGGPLPNFPRRSEASVTAVSRAYNNTKRPSYAASESGEKFIPKVSASVTTSSLKEKLSLVGCVEAESNTGMSCQSAKTPRSACNALERLQKVLEDSAGSPHQRFWMLYG